MKTIVAGSRTITDMRQLLDAINACGWKITHVVSGGADGADKLGHSWSWLERIPITTYWPSWKKHGNAAGPIRNVEMAKNAEALIALWDGQSKGTKHMIETATKLGLRVYVHRVDAK